MNGTIRIGSKRFNSTAKPCSLLNEIAIDVDRKNPILGNRHVLKNHRDLEERDKVIAAYNEDLIKDEAINGPMSREIKLIAEKVKSGQNIILMCWCAPLYDCHARHIKDRINKIINI